jgi:hypothetical protein
VKRTYTSKLLNMLGTRHRVRVWKLARQSVGETGAAVRFRVCGSYGGKKCGANRGALVKARKAAGPEPVLGTYPAFVAELFSMSELRF